MSDLLAPILRLIGDEVETFWCFVGLMQMEERMFEISQDLMKTQLENLGKLIKYLYPNFWIFLGWYWFLLCCFCLSFLVLVWYKRVVWRMLEYNTLGGGIRGGIYFAFKDDVRKKGAFNRGFTVVNRCLYERKWDFFWRNIFNSNQYSVLWKFAMFVKFKTAFFENLDFLWYWSWIIRNTYPTIYEYVSLYSFLCFLSRKERSSESLFLLQMATHIIQKRICLWRCYDYLGGITNTISWNNILPQYVLYVSHKT